MRDRKLETRETRISEVRVLRRERDQGLERNSKKIKTRLKIAIREILGYESEDCEAEIREKPRKSMCRCGGIKLHWILMNGSGRQVLRTGN